MPNFLRFYIQMSRDILPGIFNRLLGSRPQPRGRQRCAFEDWAIAVPFRYEPPPNDIRVAVIFHCFYADLAEPMVAALAASQLTADIFVSTDTAAKASIIGDVLRTWTRGSATVRLVENRGRDIAPKMITFAPVYDEYPLILFLHAKQSAQSGPGNPHTSYQDRWREYLLSCLAGSAAVIHSIKEIFRLHPEIGMVLPAHFEELRQRWPLDWGTNFRRARRLAWKMDIDIGERGIIDFPSGSMFWARPAALKPLLDLKLTFADFPQEFSGNDGTIAHQIERLFLFSCEKAGFKWAKVLNEEAAASEQLRKSINAPGDIAAFIAAHNFELLKDQPN